MNIEDFGPFTLSASAHSGPDQGMCVMEMVSFLAGEEWSDNPPCSSPIISRFCQVINDRMGQEFRDRLQTYVPRLIGTASPEHDADRAGYLVWSSIRVFAPIAMRAAGLEEWAVRLEGLSGSLAEARVVCRGARSAAAAAAAYDAAAAAAAYAAADAAYAAAYAAADAAYAAADAAYAAAAAAYAADDDAIFKVLDGLLKIGPSGATYTPAQIARVPELKRAVSA